MSKNMTFTITEVAENPQHVIITASDRENTGIYVYQFDTDNGTRLWVIDTYDINLKEVDTSEIAFYNTWHEAYLGAIGYLLNNKNFV